MILFKKEKEVLDLIEKHADKVEECLLKALCTIQAYINDDIPKAKQIRATWRFFGL